MRHPRYEQRHGAGAILGVAPSLILFGARLTEHDGLTISRCDGFAVSDR